MKIPQIQNNPMMGFINGFQTFMKNPMQFMMQRNMNIPQEISNDPDRIIQHMMDNGLLSQDQYNHAKSMAEQMKNNPMFRGMFR